MIDDETINHINISLFSTFFSYKVNIYEKTETRNYGFIHVCGCGYYIYETFERHGRQIVPTQTKILA